MPTDTSASPMPPVVDATALRARAFQVGLALCIINTIIGAGQPVITRWGAVHLDPLLFCTGATVFATLCTIPVLHFTGELRLIVDPRYRGRLFMVAMAGTVMTSLTLTYGLTRIGAVAGVLLLQTEPVYSLILSTIFVGERPSARQMLATATVLVGIGSVFAGGGSFSPLWASAIIFTTPLFWQASHVMGLKLMPPLTPTSMTGGRFFYASIVLTSMLVIFRRDSIVQLADPTTLGVIVFTGFFVYFLSGLTWYGAIAACWRSSWARTRIASNRRQKPPKRSTNRSSRGFCKRGMLECHLLLSS